MSSNSNYVYTDNIIKKNHLTNQETNMRSMSGKLNQTTGGKLSPNYDPGYTMDNNISSKILQSQPRESITEEIEKDKKKKLLTSQLKKNKTMNEVFDALFKKKKTMDVNRVLMAPQP